MIPVINEGMLAIGGSWAASIVAKATVAMSLGLIAAWLAARTRAAVRHALLAAAFGVVLALPIISVVAPSVHIAVPVFESRAASPLSSPDDAPPSVPPTYPDRPVTPASSQMSRLSLSVILLAGWMSGAALFLLPVVIGLWQIHSVRRNGLPWPHGQTVTERLAIEAGVRRRVEVLLHEALPGPMACGVVRPAIVLPQDAESWKREDLNRAIVHELEHIRRADSVTRCLARVACAIYWFHPLIWIAWRRLALEAERSCDDAVLGYSEATAYADQLVGLAKRLSLASRSLLLAMVSRADLSTRVGAVLDSKQRRGRAGALSITLACGAGIVLAIAISPLILVASPQISPSFEVASIRPSKPPFAAYQKFDPGASEFIAENYSVRDLILRAYALKEWQLSGGPAWIDSSHYDIRAKSEGFTSRNQNWTTQQMQRLQALLQQRFKLVVHRRTNEFPIYLLTVAKGGPKLERPNCVANDPNQPQLIVPGKTPGNACGGGIVGMGSGLVHASSESMTEFAETLSHFVDRTVVDNTGLSGKFRFRLSFAPDATRPEVPFISVDPGDTPTAADGPSIFTATQEQLGLKLQPTKGPVEVLVIDRVEKPSEN
jgi:bla regulator protein blaR1